MKLTKPLVVLDLETTGIWIEKDRIIEIGMVKISPDGQQAIFLTNKKPHPSICNILKHSRRFRSAFSEEQQGDVFTVLSHLGWAPQRMSSRARSMSRAVLKIDPLLTALAREAEGGSKKEAALHNLRMIAPYRRLVIAGLLADLTVEHHKCVRETDVEDPDPAEIAHQLARFESRVRVLFMQGHVWSMQNSYTMQILKFFEKPSVLLVKKNRGHVCAARPARPGGHF